MGEGLSALYDRMTKKAEEAGLREMRRETLAAASGRTVEIGSGTGAKSASIRTRSPSSSSPSPTPT